MVPGWASGPGRACAGGSRGGCPESGMASHASLCLLAVRAATHPQSRDLLAEVVRCGHAWRCVCTPLSAARHGLHGHAKQLCDVCYVSAHGHSLRGLHAACSAPECSMHTLERLAHCFFTHVSLALPKRLSILPSTPAERAHYLPSHAHSPPHMHNQHADPGTRSLGEMHMPMEGPAPITHAPQPMHIEQAPSHSLAALSCGLSSQVRIRQHLRSAWPLARVHAQQPRQEGAQAPRDGVRQRVAVNVRHAAAAREHRSR